MPTRPPASAALIAHRLPRSQADWQAKRAAVEATLDDLGGVVIRVGDETVGELWSLYDGQDVLNEVDPRFADNIRRHVARVEDGDVFHVSANTDPKGDRSKRPQEQDPDMLLHACARPMPGSWCAAPNTRPRRPMRIRPSSSRRSPTGAMPSSRTTRSASSCR